MRSKFLLVAFLSVASNAFAAVGEIGFLGGIVGEVKVNGTPAKSGDQLKIGAKIETGNDGKVQVLLGTGMVATIGYGSTAFIEKFESKRTQNIPFETAQLGLHKGSLRFLVSSSGGVVRLGTVHSGDAFGIVKNGESHFKCNEACAKKFETKPVVAPKMEK